MIGLKFVINRDGLKVLFFWNCIGRGMESKVYHKKSEAYKYYRFFSSCDRLNFQEVQYLSNISTNRILLPKDILYTITGQFKGYTTSYIEDLGLIHFMKLPKDIILHEFKLLKADCDVLGEKGVVIRDILPKDSRVSNHVFHHGLYFIDPGRFYLDFVSLPNEIVLENQKMIDDFLFFRVFSSYADYEFGKDGYSYTKLYQLKRFCNDKNISFMDFIASDICEENLENYVKRKIYY